MKQLKLSTTTGLVSFHVPLYPVDHKDAKTSIFQLKSARESFKRFLWMSNIWQANYFSTFWGQWLDKQWKILKVSLSITAWLSLVYRKFGILRINRIQIQREGEMEKWHEHIFFKKAMKRQIAWIRTTHMENSTFCTVQHTEEGIIPLYRTTTTVK